MSTALEIEAALKELPLEEARAVARWLRDYLEQQDGTPNTPPPQAPVKLPDYAAQRRMIFGDKVLPNFFGKRKTREPEPSPTQPTIPSAIEAPCPFGSGV
jgi:hypothetical protein